VLFRSRSSRTRPSTKAWAGPATPGLRSEAARAARRAPRTSHRRCLTATESARASRPPPGPGQPPRLRRCEAGLRPMEDLEVPVEAMAGEGGGRVATTDEDDPPAV